MINKEFLKTCKFNNGLLYKDEVDGTYCAFGAFGVATGVVDDGLSLMDWRHSIYNVGGFEEVLENLESRLMLNSIQHSELRQALLALAEEYEEVPANEKVTA